MISNIVIPDTSNAFASLVHASLTSVPLWCAGMALFHITSSLSRNRAKISLFFSSSFLCLDWYGTVLLDSGFLFLAFLDGFLLFFFFGIRICGNFAHSLLRNWFIILNHNWFRALWACTSITFSSSFYSSRRSWVIVAATVRWNWAAVWNLVPHISDFDANMNIKLNTTPNSIHRRPRAK